MLRRTFISGSLVLAGTSLGRKITFASGTPTASADWANPAWFTTPADLIANHVHTVMVGTQDEYLAGRITLTDVIDWSEIDLVDSQPDTLDEWQASMIHLMQGRGVGPGKSLVIADYGTLYGPRLFWVLSYLGMTSMALLDGGFPAWQAAGGEVDQGPAFIDYMPIPWEITPNPSVLVAIDEVIARVEDGKAQFIDARSKTEFAKGHLTGAINIPFLDNSIDSSGGAWKSPDELRAMYDAAGIDPEKPIIPYCTTGVRSAATWFTLNALGYSDVRLFSGSWREWTSDKSRPVEV